MRHAIHPLTVPPALPTLPLASFLPMSTGAPCGVMDQMAAALGQEARLLALHCQPAEMQGCVAIPPHLQFWGVDSGER